MGKQVHHYNVYQLISGLLVVDGKMSVCVCAYGVSEVSAMPRIAQLGVIALLWIAQRQNTTMYII